MWDARVAEYPGDGCGMLGCPSIPVMGARDARVSEYPGNDSTDMPLRSFRATLCIDLL